MSYKSDADLKLDMILAHDHTLLKSPALHPYLSSDFKYFSIATSQFCVLVPAIAYNGNYKTNTLNFPHCDMSYTPTRMFTEINSET